jgi:hypothetical protein
METNDCRMVGREYMRKRGYERTEEVMERKRMRIVY